MNHTERVRDLSQKAWKYALSAAERPKKIPNLLHSVLRGAHLADLLTINQRWVKQAGIKTVIDIGAHTGEFSSAIRAILPEVRVYAFEPLLDCYDRLTAKFKKDGCFHAYRVALGSRHGQATFWRSDFSKSSSVLPMATLHRLAFPWSAACSPIETRVDTLDCYLDELNLTPNVLLKIDVQGYEEEVLKGAAATLKQVSQVLVEVSFRPLYEGQASFDSVYELLRGYGFSYAGSLDQMLSPIDDTVLQADALFLREP